jgi:hypothetical protein
MTLFIGSAENGSRNLTLQVLVMFARSFGKPVAELLTGLEERANALSKPGRPPQDWDPGAYQGHILTPSAEGCSFG